MYIYMYICRHIHARHLHVYSKMSNTLLNQKLYQINRQIHGKISSGIISFVSIT